MTGELYVCLARNMFGRNRLRTCWNLWNRKWIDFVQWERWRYRDNGSTLCGWREVSLLFICPYCLFQQMIFLLMRINCIVLLQHHSANLPIWSYGSPPTATVNLRPCTCCSANHRYYLFVQYGDKILMRYRSCSGGQSTSNRYRSNSDDTDRIVYQVRSVVRRHSWACHWRCIRRNVR